MNRAAERSHPFKLIAVLGGVYSNHHALQAAIDDARSRGVEAIFCLGDLGAFGPNPNRVFPLLIANDVATIQGNYDDSIARGLDDCQCGYTDSRDNYFARLSYRYTYENTGPRWRDWMGLLPAHRRLRLDGHRLLLCHGSPRRTNEFLWESTTPTHFVEKLCDDYSADVILATHTGIHWSRRLSNNRMFVNVGVIGRPANDGRTNVWYALLSASEGSIDVELVPLSYDYEAFAHDMEEEGLPEEFIETILTGWWTTCNEVLPAKERRRGIY